MGYCYSAPRWSFLEVTAFAPVPLRALLIPADDCMGRLELSGARTRVDCARVGDDAAPFVHIFFQLMTA